MAAAAPTNALSPRAIGAMSAARRGGATGARCPLVLAIRMLDVGDGPLDVRIVALRVRRLARPELEPARPAVVLAVQEFVDVELPARAMVGAHVLQGLELPQMRA